MKTVNCFVFKMKMYFRGFNKIFREYFSKLSEFLIKTDFKALADFLNELNSMRKRRSVTFRPGVYYLFFFFQYLFPEFCFQMTV